MKTLKQKREYNRKRQTNERGKAAPLSGRKRELQTCQFDDDIRKAPVYALQQHRASGSDINRMLTSREIGEITFYKWRTIDAVIRNLSDHSCFKDMIVKENHGANTISYFKMKDMYRNFPLDSLMLMIEMTYDSTRIYHGKNNGPNKPESLILSILRSTHPGEWLFSGDRSEPKIGRCWPDFTCYKYKLLIEHFGDYYHSKVFTGKSKKEHEQEKIKGFKKHGWNTLVIWEKETINIKKMEQKIINFIEKNIKGKLDV